MVEVIKVTQTATRLPDGSFKHEKGVGQRPLSIAEAIALSTGMQVNQSGDKVKLIPIPSNKQVKPVPINNG